MRFLTLVFAVLATPTLAFDMRDCPLNRLVFMDYWTGAQFNVEQSFGGLKYICPVEGGHIEQDNPGPDCRRLGKIHLAGDLVERGWNGARNEIAVVATYHRIWGSPCCEWLLTSEEDFVSNPNNASDLENPMSGNISIRDSGLYPVIEKSDWSDQGLFPTNALVPVICREK